MNKRVIRDYLESLKEDNELDFIFPLLLESMGFQIISTPKNSKGQPQFGKDVVAIGKDNKGKKHKWYFELKGNAAKDITSNNFNVDDGVRDSLLAAKDAKFSDLGVPELEKLPRKIVFVHNGILKSNVANQLNGFIEREFKKGEFERWDLDKLVDLFSKYLFDECLYRDEDLYRLVKRVLATFDAPGWTTKDIEIIFDRILSECPMSQKKKRLVNQCFNSISLLVAILYKECKIVNNLLPVKRVSDIAVLKCWGWIIANNKINEKSFIKLFTKLLILQIRIYESYLIKLIPLAVSFKGLYVINRMGSEQIFYPLRCFDFIQDVIYYFEATKRLYPLEKRDDICKNSVQIILTIIKNNPGFNMPLLDTHGTPILAIFKYIWNNSRDWENDNIELFSWLNSIVNNIILRKNTLNMFPELYGNHKELAKSVIKKSINYRDESSLLLLTIIELLYLYDCDELYEDLKKVIDESDIDLQVSYPNNSDDLEKKLFTRGLNNELFVEPNIQLPDKLCDLKKHLQKPYNHIPLKTEQTGYNFLLYLAHFHYKTDWFPDFFNTGFIIPLDSK